MIQLNYIVNQIDSISYAVNINSQHASMPECPLSAI